MAETFLAERHGVAGFAQRVCVKRVLPAFCTDPVFVAMFQGEARLAARLVHPHIAQVYDFGAHEGQWWMALELVDGVDLRALLRAMRALGQPMPIDLVVLILTDVCSALAHAHAARPAVVHRDVSPSNVLLSREGAVKLADFGIAKQTSGERATASGIKGKVPYMSPEQALGGAVDARSDLFSLGVLSFELLAGRRPFDGPTELATLANLAGDRRPALGPLAPHAPPALVALVERLLAPTPDARPASANAVLDALSAGAPPLSARRALGAMVDRVRPVAPDDDAQALVSNPFSGAQPETESPPCTSASAPPATPPAAAPHLAAPAAPHATRARERPHTTTRGPSLPRSRCSRSRAPPPSPFTGTRRPTPQRPRRRPRPAPRHRPACPPRHRPACPPRHRPACPPRHRPACPPRHRPACPPRHRPARPPRRRPARPEATRGRPRRPSCRVTERSW